MRALAPLCLFAILLLFGGAEVWAQVAPAPAPASQPGNLSGMGPIINAVISYFTNPTSGAATGFITAATPYASKLKVWGLELAALLTIIKVIQNATKEFVEATTIAKQVPPARIIADAIIPLAIAGSFILAWDTTFAGQMLQTVTDFINVFSAPASGGGTAASGFVTLIDSIGVAITNLISQWPGWSLGTIVSWIMLGLGLFVALVFAIWALAEFVIAMIMGFFLLAIAIALGPLFIGTAVHEWTKGFFDRWLGFLIGAIMLAGIGNLAASIGAGVITYVSAKVYVGASGFMAWADILVLILCCFTLVKLMGSLPSIVSALVPGSLGVRSTAGIGEAAAAVAAAAGSVAVAATATREAVQNAAGMVSTAKAAANTGMRAASDASAAASLASAAGATPMGAALAGASQAVASLRAGSPDVPSLKAQQNAGGAAGSAGAEAALKAMSKGASPEQAMAAAEKAGQSIDAAVSSGESKLALGKGEGAAAARAGADAAIAAKAAGQSTAEAKLAGIEAGRVLSGQMASLNEGARYSGTTSQRSAAMGDAANKAGAAAIDALEKGGSPSQSLQAGSAAGSALDAAIAAGKGPKGMERGDGSIASQAGAKAALDAYAGASSQRDAMMSVAGAGAAAAMEVLGRGGSKDEAMAAASFTGESSRTGNLTANERSEAAEVGASSAIQALERGGSTQDAQSAARQAGQMLAPDPKQAGLDAAASAGLALGSK